MTNAEPAFPAPREGLDRLLRLLVQKNGSDLYLSANSLPVVRLHGICVPASSKLLGASDIAQLLALLVGTQRAQALQAPDQLHCVVTLDDIGQFRVNAFFQRGFLSLTLRPIAAQVPHLETGQLAPALRDLAMAKTGLLVISGGAGTGKTSTAAALLDYRNRQTSGHILTLEQPIEYQIEPKKCVVNQIGIGTDTASWDSAFEGAAKRACDVVFISEIHDAASARAALQLAQDGMLCVITMNGTSAGQTLNRLVQVFPAADRPAAQNQLSQCLKAVVVQRLARTKQGQRAALCEILVNGHTSGEIIARGAFAELDHMDISYYPGSLSFRHDADRLLSQGVVFDKDENALSNVLGNSVMPVWGSSRFVDSKDAGTGVAGSADKASPPITLSIKS
jgi:twitching motility protein PilU